MKKNYILLKKRQTKLRRQVERIMMLIVTLLLALSFMTTIKYMEL